MSSSSSMMYMMCRAVGLRALTLHVTASLQLCQRWRHAFIHSDINLSIVEQPSQGRDVQLTFAPSICHIYCKLPSSGPFSISILPRHSKTARKGTHGHVRTYLPPACYDQICEGFIATCLYLVWLEQFGFTGFRTFLTERRCRNRGGHISGL
jgi:hypothetical protein